MTAAAGRGGLETGLRECSYVYPAKIIRDLERVQATYRDFIVDFDLFSFGNGVKKKLVRLGGTIPVTYKGLVHKITLCIWLHTLHPDMVPKCFVWSLTNKGRKSGNWVDINEIMASQYLNNWNCVTSHLVGLLEDIRISFGDRAPIPNHFIDSQRQITVPQAFGSYEQKGEDSLPAESASNNAAARQFWNSSTLHGTGTRNTERRVSGETPLPAGQQAARKTEKKSYLTELMSLDLSFSEVPAQVPLLVHVDRKETKMDPVEQTTDLLGNLNLDAVLNAYNMKTSLKKPGGARAVFASDQVGSQGEHHVRHLWNTEMLNSNKDKRKVQVFKIPAGFPAHRIKDKLTIYFQRSKNGGGEILHLQYPTRTPGCAVITYVDPQVAERVVQQEWHMITIDDEDFHIQLKPYNARDDITDLAGGANAVRVRSKDTLQPHNPSLGLRSTPPGVSHNRSTLFQSLVSLEDQNFNVEDVIEAVNSSLDYDSALRFLSHECPICSDNVSFNKIVTMTHCSCSFCEACFKQYFSSTIKEKSIVNVVCPICGAPDLNNQECHEDNTEYFNLLDTQIRYYLDYEIHELFQRKLRDRTLMEMPNFRWCAHCSFGLLHELDRLRMDCPSCKKSTCCQCKCPWEPQHEHVSCENFKKWKQQNNPEYQATQLDTYLTKNGIDCPKCKAQFDLSKGGCIHFRCSVCHYEFCGGCKKPFKLGQTCGFSNSCQAKGLHAHHPRSCYYHLRDWSVQRLQQLLNMKGIPTFTAHQSNPGEIEGNCKVMEQKETVLGLKDEQCGNLSISDYSGFCEKHYKQYLVELSNEHCLDPAVLYDKEEMFNELHRWDVAIPDLNQNETEEKFIQRLRKKIIDELKLDS